MGYMINDNADIITGNCVDYINDVVSKAHNPILVSDPPFNIGYHYGKYKDRMNDTEYYEMMGDIFSLCPSVIVHYPESLYKISFQMKVTPTRVVSWVYNSNTKRQHRDIAFFNVEPDFEKVRQPYKNPNDKRIKALISKGYKGAALYDWWNINQVKNVSKQKTGHPCQMPLKVMENVIGVLPDDVTIIDPFCGSGTTLVAAKKLNRKYVGIEIDENYVAIAKERLSSDVA